MVCATSFKMLSGDVEHDLQSLLIRSPYYCTVCLMECWFFENALRYFSSWIPCSVAPLVICDLGFMNQWGQTLYKHATSLSSNVIGVPKKRVMSVCPLHPPCLSIFYKRLDKVPSNNLATKNANQCNVSSQSMGHCGKKLKVKECFSHLKKLTVHSYQYFLSIIENFRLKDAAFISDILTQNIVFWWIKDAMTKQICGQ